MKAKAKTSRGLFAVAMGALLAWGFIVVAGNHWLQVLARVADPTTSVMREWNKVELAVEQVRIITLAHAFRLSASLEEVRSQDANKELANAAAQALHSLATIRGADKPRGSHSSPDKPTGPLDRYLSQAGRVIYASSHVGPAEAEEQLTRFQQEHAALSEWLNAERQHSLKLNEDQVFVATTWVKACIAAASILSLIFATSIIYFSFRVLVSSMRPGGVNA
ncbi:hypothetical protein AACH06_29010 [Ideonella sp. DXS29W]|uniref:Chemotaxis methyl-accepting receptor HlyB-like 4HB MCP domain-containing protein n=1 Tax=Ideonella lacteola TaxID=2984193 RepID=A0ABU9C1C4_9BURK